MRVGIGGIWHETNTFALAPSTSEDFKNHLLLHGEEIAATLAGTGTEIGGMIAAARELGMELAPTLYAGALPSGTVDRGVFEGQVAEIVAGLRRAGPLDGVLLALHGAMVADGHLDAEGHLLTLVREAVGSAPIAVTLDLHANISETMVEMADIIVGYDTYPHIDFFERGREATELLFRTVNGNIRPEMVLVKPPLMPPAQKMYTHEPPMADLIAMAHRWEDAEDVLAVTVAGGFAYADVPFAGVSVVAITDGQRGLAERVGRDIANHAFERAEAFLFPQLPVADGVAKAIKAERGPVALVDAADNIGGGTPGDGTVVLEELLRQNAPSAVVCLADAEAVALCLNVGIEGAVDIEVGGKTDGLHGKPVRVAGRVRHLSDGKFTYKGSFMPGKSVAMGRTAVLDCAGITIVLSELKTPPFDQEQLRSVGLDPLDFKIIVVKSAVAWRAAYGDIVAEAIEVNTPGLCAADLTRFAYNHVRRPIFPLDPLEEVAAYAQRAG